jgi:hypothetical protein
VTTHAEVTTGILEVVAIAGLSGSIEIDGTADLLRSSEFVRRISRTVYTRTMQPSRRALAAARRTQREFPQSAMVHGERECCPMSVCNVAAIA